MLGINGGNSSTCFFIIYVFHTEMEAILSLFSPDSIIIQHWNIFVVIFFPMHQNNFLIFIDFTEERERKNNLWEV